MGIKELNPIPTNALIIIKVSKPNLIFNCIRIAIIRRDTINNEVSNFKYKSYLGIKLFCMDFSIKTLAISPATVPEPFNDSPTYPI
jgi:hypothetical protein